MWVTARAEAAVRATGVLARLKPGALLPVGVLSEQCGIPPVFLQQVLVRLRRAGIVASIRGRTGGFRLNLPPARVSLGQVIRASQDTTAPSACVCGGRKPPCRFRKTCALRRVWQRIWSASERVVDSVTLEDLAAGRT